MENDKINKQLNRLEDIQTIISNKDILTDAAKFTYEKKQRTITFLITTVVFSILGFFATYFFYNSSKLTMVLIGLFLLYLIISFYVYNVLYLKDAISLMLKYNIFKLGKLIQKTELEIINKIDTNLYGSRQDWINNNCSQPCNEEDAATPNQSLNIGNNIVSEEDAYSASDELAGYFYNDGDAPSQLLYPEPNILMSMKSNNSAIKYPDYDKKNYENKYANDIYRRDNHKIGQNLYVGDDTYTTNL